MKISRNRFLKLVGTTAAASVSTSTLFATARQPSLAVPTASGLRQGLASYTLRKLSLQGVIEVCKRLALKGIALKSMHMPLDASPQELRAIAASVREAGLELYGAGVIYMKSPQEVEAAFKYAQICGLETIVGVPNHELLPLTNKLVQQYNIKVAIHNHGPGDDLYSSPNDVWARIKDLDKRIGFCIDVGHVVRIGEDPVPMLEKYKDRLFDVHIKDVDKAEPEGESVEMGRGVIDIPAIVRTLTKINYRGYVAFEYEKDGDDPVPGLAESVGYFRGVTKMV